MATRRVILEIVEGVEPVRGWLVEDGRRTPFYGWLDLARLISAPPTADGGPAGDRPSPT